jgi:uncharacterized protein
MLVLQATPFCNIDCKYCYLLNRSKKDRMSTETLHKIFSNLFGSGLVSEELIVVWHMGEPLAVPIEFYVNAIEKIEELNRLGIKVSHCVQTNGMFIDDSWCKFFQDYDVQVGVSIDGPQSIHDQNRVTRSGVGTYAEVIRGIRCLKRHNIKFSVITVLTAHSLEKVEELYEFYVSEGIESLAFNIEEIEGANRTSSLGGAKEQVSYRDFMRRFWNLNAKHKKIPYIREFNDMLDKIVAASEYSDVYNALVDPLAIMVVDYKGDFSTFCPEFLGMANPNYGDFVIGNLCTQDLRDALRSDVYDRLSRDVEESTNICKQSCEYFLVCGGGSPVNKLCENGSLAIAETMYCRLSTKVVADLAVEIWDAAAAERSCTNS